jgi:hypothetical protein
MSPRDPQTARLVAFPDLKPATRHDLMRGEIGTEFDQQSRMFGMFGTNGDVFLPRPMTTVSGRVET